MTKRRVIQRLVNGEWSMVNAAVFHRPVFFTVCNNVSGLRFSRCVRTVLLAFLLSPFVSFAQKADTARKFAPLDSLVKKARPLADAAKVDSLRHAFTPKKATLRSLMIPGWGQAYVGSHKKGSFLKKYWKVPVVYGALGTAAGIFFYNLTNYREIRFAYAAKYKASLPKYDPASPYPGPYRDSSDYFQIKPYLLPIDLNSLRSYRDEFRSNIDYSVLAFILLWGLQVAEATADAHLLAFDVSPDLSFRFKFGPSQMANTTGLSLVLGIKDKKDRRPALRSLPF